ncbi:hypothetical protein, partial [Streptomyces sp. f51]|uniref:hypothetical protein n=1 Tax=Streptomyces sp. f51 TaxID=1827742 RepID=UPI001C54F108
DTEGAVVGQAGGGGAEDALEGGELGVGDVADRVTALNGSRGGGADARTTGDRSRAAHDHDW